MERGMANIWLLNFPEGDNYRVKTMFKALINHFHKNATALATHGAINDD